MTAFFLNHHHCVAIDKALGKLLRFLLRRRTRKEGEEPTESRRRVKQWQVYNYWRIVSSATELRVRRLKTYQRWVVSPSNHIPELAAVLCTARLDEAGGRRRLGSDGKPNEWSTPWAGQMWEDFQALKAMEDGESVWEEISRRGLIEAL